jgi:hypothetical protein
MAKARRTGGRGKPRPSARTPKPLDLDARLLPWIAEQYRLGKQVGRETPMREFGVSREALDKAHTVYRYLETLTTAGKGILVRKFLWEKSVHRWITDENRENRERQTNKDKVIAGRANAIYHDLQRRIKQAEREKREARDAKSPFEETITAELELLRLAEYCKSVSTNPDLMHPDRLADAMRMVVEYAQEGIANLTEPVIDAEIIDVDVIEIENFGDNPDFGDDPEGEPGSTQPKAL